MKDRGMLKWLPYKSLDQQSDYLAKMAYERKKISHPLIAEEKAEEINDLLSNYHGEFVILSFYEDGYVHQERGNLEEINSIYKYIKINSNRILFHDIVDLVDA